MWTPKPRLLSSLPVQRPPRFCWNPVFPFVRRAGLLEREEEIALAKQLDLGTRQIRQVLQQAAKLCGRLKRTEQVTAHLQTLQTVRRLSGLSATALNEAEEALTQLQGDTTIGTRYRWPCVKGPGVVSPSCAPRVSPWRPQR